MKKRIAFVLVLILGGIVLMSGCVDRSAPIVINEEAYTDIVYTDINRNITTTTFEILKQGWGFTKKKTTGRIKEVQIRGMNENALIFEDGYFLIVDTSRMSLSGKCKRGSIHEIITKRSPMAVNEILKSIKIIDN